LDNEPFCDFECDVVPVEDFHDGGRWISMWCDEVNRGDYWLNAYCDASRERNVWRGRSGAWERMYQQEKQWTRRWWALACIGPVVAVLLMAVLR
jgi:hypothetical protein